MDQPTPEANYKPTPKTSTPNRCEIGVNNIEDKVLLDNLLAACASDINHNFSVASDLMLAINLTKDETLEVMTKALHGESVNVIAVDQRTIIATSGKVFGIFTFQQRSKYSTMHGRIWCQSYEVKRNFNDWARSIFKDKFIQGDICGLRWAYKNRHGLSASYLEELLTDEVLDEAYPSIVRQYGSLHSFAKAYLEGEESVLLLQGPPGTGKSRLIRYIMRKLVQLRKVETIDTDEYYGEDSNTRSLVLYTSDTDSLKTDELFAFFMTSDEVMFVVEDADNMLRSRASGNDDVHRFLTVSDGIIRNVGRKVVFTTNLANMHDVDEALTRPGRCFAGLSLGGLKKEEAFIFAEKLTKGHKDALQGVHSHFEKNKMMTLAEIYKMWKIIGEKAKLR